MPETVLHILDLGLVYMCVGAKAKVEAISLLDELMEN